MPLLDNLEFVTNGTWGTGKGSPLTAAECDTNIYTLADAIQDLIDNPVSGVELTNIVVTGSEVVFYMSDATTRGPFQLPMAYPRYRGEWAASTSYAAMDIVQTQADGTFLVLLDHTSGLTFDENDGNSAGDYYVKIAPAQGAPYINTADSTLTLDETHAGKYIRCSNGSGITVTVPADVFADNAEIHFRQTSTGPVTLVPENTGVVINVRDGFDTATAVAGDTLTIKHITANEFDIFGNLAEISA